MNCSGCILLSFLVGLIFCNDSKHGVKELSTNKAYEEFKAQKTAQAIFYYHHTSDEEKFTSRTVQMFKDVNDLLQKAPPSYIVFGLVNCKGRTIDESKIPQCSKQKRMLYMHKDDRSERIHLNSVYSHNAFEAHAMSFIYALEVGYVDSVDDWQDLQYRHKTKKDVVLMYFEAVGCTSHFFFMKFVTLYIHGFAFAYTTNQKVAIEMGLKEGHNNALWYASCKKIPFAADCDISTYSSPMQPTFTLLSTFVILHSLPLVSDINKDGSNIYRNYADVLYLLVNNDENRAELTYHITPLVNSLIDLGVNFRAVLLDYRVYPELFPRFGIYNEQSLPTVMLEKLQNKGNSIIEPFTIDTDLTLQNIFTFLHDHFRLEDETLKKTASVYGITKVTLSDWKNLFSENRTYLLAACTKEKSSLKVCEKFVKNFRRLVRTMFVDAFTDYNFVYVDYTGAESLVSLPLLRLLRPKQDTESFGNHDLSYTEMLQWVNEKTSSNLQELPLASCDSVNLIQNDIEENNDLIDYDDSSLDKMEDDEIAVDALKQRGEVIYEDGVMMLTDKTFDRYLNDRGTLVVLFYVPYDDRSYFFQPQFETLKNKFESEQTSEIRLMKVDCSSEYNTCGKLQTNAYPTIRMFKDGVHLTDYKGFLNADSLEKHIRLYQAPECLFLQENEVIPYTEGLEPKLAKQFTDVSFFGWFSDVDNGLHLYKSIAKASRGKALFAYTVGEGGKGISSKSTDARFHIVAYKFNDDLNKTHVYDGELSRDNLMSFVNGALLPTFGELTPLNLPSYLAISKPMLVLFHDNSADGSVAYKAIEELSKQGILDSLHTVWMNTKFPVTKTIRLSYLGARKHKQDDVVIVFHNKGEVYHFSGPQGTIDQAKYNLVTWYNDVIKGAVQATSYLATRQWKPLREGFDYLRYIAVGVPRAKLDFEPEGIDEPTDNLAGAGNDGRQDDPPAEEFDRSDDISSDSEAFSDRSSLHSEL